MVGTISLITAKDKIFILLKDGTVLSIGMKCEEYNTIKYLIPGDVIEYVYMPDGFTVKILKVIPAA